MKALIQSILAQLKLLTAIQFVAVWNNQFAMDEKSDMYTFPYPCAFLEVVAIEYNELGSGVQEADVTIRIHLGHESLDAGDGTMEQNLLVFDLRDQLVENLSYFRPTNGTTSGTNLVKIRESHDYNHTNVYHMSIEFKFGWVDLTSSPHYGPQNTQITKQPPTNLQINHTP